MAQFATAPELASYLGVTFTAEERSRADDLLEQASAAIQNYTGQRLEYVEDDEVTLYAQGEGRLFLPELPVVEVSSVEVDGTALTSTQFSWETGGALSRGTTLWGSAATFPPVDVVVTYSHGYETIPSDIRLACMQLAATGFRGTEGVSSESIGTYAVSYSDAEGTDEEALKLLDRYRVLTVA